MADSNVRPVRLQLSRARGFRLQAHSLATNGLACVSVARPGPNGNPFSIAASIESGYATAVTAPAFVVDCFRDWLGGSDRWWQGDESDRRRAAILDGLPQLRGHNLACWCGLDAPCHGAVLLERANA